MIKFHLFFIQIVILPISIEPHQIPFLLKSSSSSSSSSHSFQLQHAIHISHLQNQNLIFQRDFHHHDRIQINLKSNLDPFNHYHSTQILKSRPGKIWTHNASLSYWKSVHQKNLKKNYQNSSSYELDSSSFNELNWKRDQVNLPDVDDIETLASLAKMTNDAYILPGDNQWYDPNGNWNLSHSFGWENDGVRGHIFATTDNSTIVVAIKGTSASVLGNGGPTGTRDKFNDNLFFSCCCARVSWTWTPVCDCYAGGGNQCREQCLEDALTEKSTYFSAIIQLYDHLVWLYPTSQIWLTGHSLGGALVGLLGVTFGVPAVAFEAPGDLLPAKRLHLPLPPHASFGEGQERSEVIHVYHTADPISMGTCNGALSSCSIAGYAFDTKCHIGQAIIFDTVKELKWAEDIRNHPIQIIIQKLLRPNWKNSESIGILHNFKAKIESFFSTQQSIVPKPQIESCKQEAMDCSQWDFI
ncbi:hypothetical protein O181_033981 [Austropuccinia psidii MF-1]|uniref:triacylglycerol lipase n=1 Tax=Austropuccinia psidii MF-1 TaxID=1389203 RepID=A0A9Q3CZT0_9BASI|nr:hypothetical protein [Austropuccinia psidii MF-1]